MPKVLPKVLIADTMSPHCVEVFRDRGIAVETETGLAPEALAERIGAYDGLAVRSATRVSAELMAAAPRLKVVGRAGIGVDNIDVAAATQRGVVVMNTPFGNSITTAEHTIAMLMALARQIPQADRSTHSGRWEKSRFMGTEVAGKTLGLIGCGNIGSIVADRAQGLKMRVIVHDPYLAPERAGDLNVERVELEALLARADFISVHTPLTETTRGMLDAKTLTMCKPGVRIINCARGGLVIEADLRDAILSGQVAGAAIDVFAEEPARENPLFGLDQVIATPHLGAATAEAQQNVAVQIAEQMADYLLNGAVTNALNMPSVSAEEAPRLRPYLTLAAQLGRFAGQVTETGLRAVSVEFEGHAATLNTRPLTAVVLEGLLSPLMESVNMVNAPVVAKERDIDVREIKHEGACDYHTLIRLTVTTEARTRAVAGTLFGDGPRLVQVKGIKIEAELGPHMLFVTNKDKPGFIGSLGQTLADAEINIATFHLGRAAPGADAIALVEVDQPLDDPVLARVQALPHVVRATALNF
ncbi:MAG: phosphoglycerate dehydrogenase [Alphaproteobacteria bacterium]|jgi:D-3-phosphoglycerate dehydrogenase|nr:phosphoglycerate dehydrogenase [Alphaproteobacteria bacterium]MDP6516720.1 phosphoglycerate dehydrogenase [Alphaproteobacteria bacterium]